MTKIKVRDWKYSHIYYAEKISPIQTVAKLDQRRLHFTRVKVGDDRADVVCLVTDWDTNVNNINSNAIWVHPKTLPSEWIVALIEELSLIPRKEIYVT